jgi:excisionase family DNA binding protein
VAQRPTQKSGGGAVAPSRRARGMPSNARGGMRAGDLSADRQRRPMLTIDEVANLFHTTVRHIRRLVHERKIPHHKLSGKLRFDQDEIDQWLDESAVVPVHHRRNVG